MSTYIRNIVTLALAVAPINTIAAQHTITKPVVVTLVAGPTPSKGGRTEVVRRAQGQPQNFVIVDVNATAEDLAGALATINRLRVQFGDSLTSDLRARIESARPGPTWQASEYRTWLIQQLVRLRTARSANLGDLGSVKSVQIMLPPPAVRASTG
jgi:hypothetical protein